MKPIVYITKGNSTVNFYIEAWLDTGYQREGYSGYTTREALKRFREGNNLKHKKIELIDMRKENTK